MGGYLSSKLLVVTTTTTTSFRSFLSFGSSSNHPPPPPPPPRHHHHHHHTNNIYTNTATTSDDHDDDYNPNSSSVPTDPPHDTRFDFMVGEELGPSLLDDHHPPPPPRHRQTTTVTSTSSSTTQEYLFLHKQLAGVDPESNGMVLVPVVRSRSFHTVEEYDAIVNMLDDHYLSSTHYKYSQKQPPQVLPNPDHHHHKYSNSWSNISREAPDDEDDQPSNSIGGDGDDDYSISTNIRDCSSDKQVMRSSGGVVEESSNSSCKDAVFGSERDHQPEDEGEGRERSIKLHRQGRSGEIRGGSKRKTMLARGVQVGSIQVPAVPPPLEFTTTVSLRQWLPGGGSDYATPKFGSYNNNIHVVGGGDESSSSAAASTTLGEEAGGGGGGKGIIEPELVAAFEECLQQLEREEEKLIKQIEEDI